jgi:5'-3' exonuclease
MWAKADDYCKRCGADTGRIAHAVAADVMLDVAEACRNFACAPVMAFDSSRSLRREQLYADYKGNRGTQKKTEKEERVVGCKEEIKRLLRCVYAPGYNVQGYCVHGYESDDVIASFVLGLKQQTDGHVDGKPKYDKPVVIVSNDHDLHQVVLEGVKWADVTTGVLCDADDIEKHTKIAIADVVAAKCVGGCKSDNVGNVPGCGEKTVAEFLANRSFNVSVPKARAALNSDAGAEILRRNLRLVRLPYDGEPSMPPLLLSAKAWPKPGVPEDMAALMDSNGVPRSAWPSFADVTLPRAEGAVPVCAYNKK